MVNTLTKKQILKFKKAKHALKKGRFASQSLCDKYKERFEMFKKEMDEAFTHMDTYYLLNRVAVSEAPMGRYYKNIKYKFNWEEHPDHIHLLHRYERLEWLVGRLKEKYRQQYLSLNGNCPFEDEADRLWKKLGKKLLEEYPHMMAEFESF
jgi:hypothetical protein